MEPIEVRKHIKKIMTAYRTDSLYYQVLDEAQKIIKNNINSEQASQEALRFIVDAFPAVIFNTFKDADDTWYTIRAEYIEETENGYVYKLSRRLTMTAFVSDADAQFIMVKLSHRPDENDLKDIWDKAVKNI